MHDVQEITGMIGGFYAKSVPKVPDLETREFGFGSPEKKIETRHMWYRTGRELADALRKARPFYVSYSAAHYELPAARPMVKKNWLGADLIFDLDAPAHDCGKFTCDECLAKIRAQTETLANEFLIDDFGIPKSEISVNFSGNRGYHIHVRDKRFFDLNREARREIADYITGTGITYEDFFHFEEAKKNHRLVKSFRGPSPKAGGYHGKIGRALEKELEDAKFRGSLNRKLRDDAVFASFMAGVYEGDYDRLNIAKRDEKFKEIFSRFAKKLPREIDVNVTCDVSKLIRLPDSIHGGSGFASRTFALEKIGEFMPRQDAAAFGWEPREVAMTEAAPELDFGEFKIGPYAPGSVQKLPATAAAYLVLKGAATFHGSKG